MGDGPIPWTAIRLYAKEHELEGDEAEFFHKLISAMDMAYLTYMAKKRDKKKITLEKKQPVPDSQKGPIRQKRPK